MGNGPSLAVAVTVPLLGGMVNGFLTQKDILGWYKKLKKPSWNPPNWLFGPVWSVLYVSMGAASWFVYKQPGAQVLPLTLYGVQLVLNWAWQPLFFKAHKLDIALADSAAMVGVTALATVAMSQSAGPKRILPLMLPYLAWISYATALNYKLMQLNPNADKIPTDSWEDIAQEGAQKAKAAKDAAVDKTGGAGKKVAAKVDEAADAAPRVAAKAEAKVDEAAKDVKEAAT
jgi:benzodiazapine receptor